MAIEGIDEKGWKDIPFTPVRRRLHGICRPVLRGQEFEVRVKSLPPECEVLQPPTFGTDCEYYVFGEKNVLGRFARSSPVILKPEPQDVVVYADGDRIKHVGVLTEEYKVVSKWGMWGPVMRHPLELVPESYGDGVCFRRRGSE